MKYFSLDDIRKERNNARLYSARFERLHFFRIRNLKDLCGRLPEDEEVFFIETTKSFNAFTFIVYLIRHAGRIDNLFVATYSINDRIISSLIRWKEAGLIGSVEIEISASIKFRMPKVYDRLELLAKSGRIIVRYEWTHRKVTCLKTPSGFFVVEGSGNYGENAMKEQYVFCKSTKVYDFRYNPECSQVG
jgi:hypothetical protein